MRYGVISDTHRNIEFFKTAVQWLHERKHIAGLYHLGDDYEDVKELKEFSLDIVQVPGTYNQGYRDGTQPHKVIQTVLGLRIMLVHALDKDFEENDRYSCDVVLHGHTHKAELALQDGLLYFNPGHLKGERDKNMTPSFGLLDIQERQVVAEIYDLDFTLLESLELIRSENGLYKAS